VTDEKGNPPETSGESTTRRGEEIARDEKEAGRHDTGKQGASERPAGKSTARDRTGVDPQGPITATPVR
jgi:hypothetical protein